MESKLWYKQPANLRSWNEALPIGNGRLGAMVFGGTMIERIQLNEDSLWSGGFRKRQNPYAKANLGQIRTLLREGKVSEAEDLSRYALTGTPEYQRTYQNLGDLQIRFQNMPDDMYDYERSLCLNDAVASTTFMAGGFPYRREVFASAPADVIVVKLSTDNPEGLSFDARLVRPRLCENTGIIDESSVYVNGINGGEDGISFHMMMTAAIEGGDMEATGSYFVFRNVQSAVLYVTASTSYRSKNTLEACQNILSKAKVKPYEKHLAEHLTDYKALESRVSLCIGGGDNSELPTDERLSRIKEGYEDAGLVALYFRYGRYLLISCSRKGTLPANLQGIWCGDFLPPWDSKFTININTQMNYWPAEICNLAECHVSLFEHLHRMHSNGTEVARDMYGARGFVAHHNTDLWADCAPQDTYIPSTYWVMGAAWLCLHVWEHYEYSLDTDFLDKHFYLLKDVCIFFEDHLIENTKGELVVSPTSSPENTYIPPEGKPVVLCEGCAMDSQILWELFTAFEKACHILGEYDDFAKKIASMRIKLPPISIGKDGSIMEWLDEKIEAELGHRHISHLFALFPGGSISPEHTPELAKAAEQTLRNRLAHGGGHTGWSRAWIINFWAKLGDADEAYDHLMLLLRHSTLPNLFDDHPPFQIDGNFGGTAAIAHMLLESSTNTVYLLKSLPKQWRNGYVSGLRAKGGLTVNINWQNGKLKNVRLVASMAYRGKLIYNGVSIGLDLKEGEEFYAEI
ncbi:MAG: glycoside hydrolase family 95 protein [Defluviitaleaceae bacterium]|nr:glycoside hydrolase family 95 protein [Defluviitaleaceae bacterium]